MHRRLGALGARLILLVCIVQLFDGWRAFKIPHAQAVGRSCAELFLPDQPLRRLFDKAELKALDKAVARTSNSKNRKQKKVLAVTSARLRELGFQTQIVKDDEGKNLIELTGFQGDHHLARMISRAVSRFQTRFFIDPYMGGQIGDSGSYLNGPNWIVLNPLKNKSDLARLGQVVRHEIRHAFFERLLRDSVENPFQIEFYANDGKTLGDRLFADEYISAEEVSNYYKDAKSSVRDQELGVGRKKIAIGDLKYLREICQLTIRYLDQFATQDLSRVHVERTETGFTVIYTIRKEAPNGAHIGTADVHLVSLPETATDDIVYQASQEKVRQLRAIAIRHLNYAEAELARFKSL